MSAQLTERDDQIEFIHRSVAWRISKPLRELNDELRRMNPKLWAKFIQWIYWTFTFQLFRQLKVRRAVREIQDSGLFDWDYYSHRYPEVVLSGMNCIRHYVEYGAKAGHAQIRCSTLHIILNNVQI